MSDLLIDASGKAWPVDEHGISRRLGPSFGRTDFVVQAVRRGGSIYLRALRREAIVVFRPAVVSRAAIFGTLHALLRLQPERLVLSYRTSYGTAECTREIFGEIDAALERIEQLSGGGREDAMQPLHAVQRRPLDRIDRVAGGRLLAPLQLWTQTGGWWTPEVYERLGRMRLLESAVISRAVCGGQDFAIDHWGAKIGVFGRTWSRVAAGRTLENHIFPDFGRRMSAVNREVTWDAAPRLDEADLVVEPAGGKLTRWHYNRLRGRDGEAFVTAFPVTCWTQRLG